MARKYPVAHNLKYGPPDSHEWRDLVRQAVTRAGTKIQLARDINCCIRTVYRWQHGMPPIKRSYEDVLRYLDGH